MNFEHKLPPDYVKGHVLSCPSGTVGVLGRLSLEEWWWEKDCTEKGYEQATADYVRNLAETAEYFQTRPSEEAAHLRARVAVALLHEEKLDPFFPGHEINSATEEFLAAYLGEELYLAEQAQAVYTLAEWEPAVLIGRLTGHLPRRIGQDFERTVMRFDSNIRTQFLRYCSGERPKRLGGELYSEAGKGAFYSGRMLLCEKVLHLAGVDASVIETFPSLYPSQQASLFRDLPEYIGVINKEAQRLGCRITTEELQRIARSMGGRSASTTSALLTAYNSPVMAHQRGPSDLHFRVTPYVAEYRKQFSHLFDPLRVRNIKRSRRIEDAQTKTLIGIAGRGRIRCPVLSRAEEIEFAKQIEAASWAEIRYAYAHPQEHMLGGVAMTALEQYKDQGGRLGEVSDEELLTIIETGKHVFVKLIQHNMGFIYNVMIQKGRSLGTQLNMRAWVHLGLSAFARTIYKFDYQKGYKIITYFKSWAREYADNMSAAERGLTLRQWSDIGVLRKRKADLLQTLHKEPTDAELRASLGWGTKRFEQVTDLMNRKLVNESAGELHESLLGDTRMNPEAAVLEKENEPTLLAYKELIDPEAFLIIQLRFEEDKELDEIASQLNMTERQVEGRLRKALTVIGQRVQEEGRDGIYSHAVTDAFD